MLRLTLAFLLTPFPAALLHAVLVALWPMPGLAIYRHPASMFAAMVLVHYALGLVFGVPLYLALRRRSANRLRAYALAGLLIVIVPLALAFGWLVTHAPIPEGSGSRLVFVFLKFGIGGLLTGAAFWFLARPDCREERRRAALEKTRLSGAFQ
jgi:hypothetical protein